MSQLEDLLRKSVIGMNEAYSIAEKDLYEEVVAASEAVVNVTSGIGRLELKKSSDEASGSIFTLSLVGQKTIYEVGAFALSANGYPIKAAPTERNCRMDIYEAVLNSRGEINEYLKNMMATPNSRLVLRVSYLLRQQERSEQ